MGGERGVCLGHSLNLPERSVTLTGDTSGGRVVPPRSNGSVLKRSSNLKEASRETKPEEEAGVSNTKRIGKNKNCNADVLGKRKRNGGTCESEGKPFRFYTPKLLSCAITKDTSNGRKPPVPHLERRNPLQERNVLQRKGGM